MNKINFHSPLEPGKYYHIFNRGNNKENIFRDDDNCNFFLRRWKNYIDSFADTYAYCLMPNHFHFLIKIMQEEAVIKRLGLKATELELPSFNFNTIFEGRFKKLLSSYALSFNKRFRRTGSLFQKRFKRLEIGTDDYLIRTIRYIHRNPIHHHFVDNYKDWKYSSYNSILSGAKTLVKRDEVLKLFGGIKRFEDFHNGVIGLTGLQDIEQG